MGWTLPRAGRFWAPVCPLGPGPVPPGPWLVGCSGGSSAGSASCHRPPHTGAPWVPGTVRAFRTQPSWLGPDSPLERLSSWSVSVRPPSTRGGEGGSGYKEAGGREGPVADGIAPTVGTRGWAHGGPGQGAWGHALGWALPRPPSGTEADPLQLTPRNVACLPAPPRLRPAPRDSRRRVGTQGTTPRGRAHGA